LEKLHKHTIKKRKDLLSAYLLASRLCTFLSDSIPSHPGYFSTPISTLACTLSYGNPKQDKLKAARKRSQEQLETVLEYLGKITFMIDYEELLAGGLIPRSMLASTNKKGEEEDSFHMTNTFCVAREQALLAKKEEDSTDISELYSKSIVDQDEEPQVSYPHSGERLESTPPRCLPSPHLPSKILKRFESSELLVAKETARFVHDCDFYSTSSILNSIVCQGDENPAWAIDQAHSENSHIIGQHSMSLPWTLDCSKSVTSVSGSIKLKRPQRRALKTISP
jgi:hypothetical protein